MAAWLKALDAVDFFLTRYSEVHSGLVDGLFGSLSDTQLRARPHPGVNTVAWLLWHSARVEDVALNRFLTDRPQVLDEWIGRLAVPRRDVGTGMTDAPVEDLSARLDLQALLGYLGAGAALRGHVQAQSGPVHRASRRRATNFSPTPRSAKFPN